MGNNDIALLKCTSSYPAPIAEANISMIKDMNTKFGLITGLSDHTLGATVPIAATALGAKIIEKHFILNRSVGGPDSSFSMDESEFSAMVLRQDNLFTIETQTISGNKTADNALPELNIHEAAKNLNMDMDVYKKILSRFFNNNIHTMDRLRTAVNQNQWKHIQSLAHGLKGSSGNIGAEQVKKTIEKIELFCRNLESDPSDKIQINLLLSKFEHHFTRLLSSIKSIIKL
jgi:sialic acid synthase SpsE